MSREDTVELRWILRVLRRWAWLIAGCALFAGGIALAVTSQLPPVYNSTATMLILLTENTGMSEYTTLAAGERLALNYTQMLKGRDMLQAVIDRLGLPETPDQLARRIAAESIKDTQLVRVTATDHSPAGAAQLANTLAEVLVARTQTMQESRYRDAIDALEAKLAALQRDIDETRTNADAVSQQKISDETGRSRLSVLLAGYRADYGTLQERSRAVQLAATEAARTVRVAEPARLEEEEQLAPLAGLNLAPGSTPEPSGPTQPITRTATVTLLVNQAPVSGSTDYSSILASERLAATYMQMVTGRPVMEAAAKMIGYAAGGDALARKVRVELVPNTQLIRVGVSDSDGGRATVLADAVATAFLDQTQALLAKPYNDQLIASQTQLDSLSAKIGEAEARLELLTAANLRRDAELAQLNTALADYRSDYRNAQHDLEQLRLTATRAENSVTISEHATPPNSPTQNQWLYVVVAAAVAAALALGLAFFLEHLDETVRTPDDVDQELGLGTLGIISRLGRRQTLPVIRQPDSASAEAFRVLAANVRLAGASTGVRTLLVTSPAAAEGKSLVTANLAAALARSGLRVVAIDGDLRRPRMHELFGLPQKQGLTNALQEGSVNGNLQSTPVEGLRVLARGDLPVQSSDIITCGHIEKLLAELGQDADMVIIDSPPVLAVADTTVLASASDGVLLVVRVGRTWAPSARRAVEALQRSGTRVVGAVLNDVFIPKKGYYYYNYGKPKKGGSRKPNLA